MNESTNGIYDMILGRDLLTALGLDLNFIENVIIGGEGPYEGCLAPMFDVRNYNFKYIRDKILNKKNPLLTCTSTNASNPTAR